MTDMIWDKDAPPAQCLSPVDPGIFAHHNCYRCRDGTRPDLCPTANRPGNCGNPIARND